MKKILLVFASLLIGLTTASATELNNRISKTTIKKNNSFAQPIVFAERGVKFLIFSNGTFNFIRDKNHYTKRNITIVRNKRGTIKRIGNVTLNYDRLGRVTNIGSVSMTYNNQGRNSSLTKVGHLNVKFNKKGKIINTYGQINRSNKKNNTAMKQKNKR